MSFTYYAGEDALMEETKTKQSFYLDVSKFYAPLAATSVLMMVTHSVVSGAIARTASPAVALAAYSAAFSVGQVFEAPCYGMQRMVLTLGKDRRNFAVVSKAAYKILFGIVLLFIAVAWTGLSVPVLKGALGLSDEIYARTLPSLRIFLLWPISSAVRSIYQSPIILRKKTYWLTVNMLIRVGIMVTAAGLLPGVWPWGPVGATILMSGLCTEAGLAVVVGGPMRKELSAEDSIPEVSESQALKFFLPLAVAACCQTLAKPVLTGAMSRTLRPEISLAGYQIAWSYMYIFGALTFNIYQAVLVYVKDRVTYLRVRRFAMALGALGTLCLFVSAVPSVGTFVFGRLIGATQEVADRAAGIMGVFAWIPLISSIAEFYSGILMLKGKTVHVTAAKIANAATSSIMAMWLSRIIQANGALAGAICVVTGLIVEALLAIAASKKVESVASPW